MKRKRPPFQNFEAERGTQVSQKMKIQLVFGWIFEVCWLTSQLTLLNVLVKHNHTHTGAFLHLKIGETRRKQLN